MVYYVRFTVRKLKKIGIPFVHIFVALPLSEEHPYPQAVVYPIHQ